MLVCTVYTEGYFVQCASKTFSSYVCTYSILFCVLYCPFRYGDQTHSHTPRLLFVGNVKAMYTSPLKRIGPHSFHLLLPLYFFSLALPVVLLYRHLSNCKVVVPVFLCLPLASSITTWWWLWKPRHWLKTLLVLFIFSFFSYITAFLHFLTYFSLLQLHCSLWPVCQGCRQEDISSEFQSVCDCKLWKYAFNICTVCVHSNQNVFLLLLFAAVVLIITVLLKQRTVWMFSLVSPMSDAFLTSLKIFIEVYERVSSQRNYSNQALGVQENDSLKV